MGMHQNKDGTYREHTPEENARREARTRADSPAGKAAAKAAAEAQRKENASVAMKDAQDFPTFKAAMLDYLGIE